MGAMKILIADDDEGIRPALEIWLRMLGHEVHAVKDALRAFTHAQKVMPDVVLLDINMPRGSGLDVLSLLKGSPATRHIPVIVISGSNEPEMPEQTKRRGAVDYLAKPFDFTQVRDALERHVEKARHPV